MTVSKGYEPRWDITLSYGKQAEDEMAAILKGARTFEVKHKSYIDTWFYVETDCRRADGWQPSGIQTTKADYWVYEIGDTGIFQIIPTSLLRKALAHWTTKPKEETDGSHPTKGRLVHLGGLFSTWGKENRHGAWEKHFTRKS